MADSYSQAVTNMVLLAAGLLCLGGLCLQILPSIVKWRQRRRRRHFGSVEFTLPSWVSNVGLSCVGLAVVLAATRL